MTLPVASRLSVRLAELAGSDVVAHLRLTDTYGNSFRTLGDYGSIRTQWPVVGGQATVEFLPPGGWYLDVSEPGGRSWSDAVTTQAGQTTEVKIGQPAW